MDVKVQVGMQIKSLDPINQNMGEKKLYLIFLKRISAVQE